VLDAPSESLVRHRAGAGEPLVLLHGVGESSVGWRPVQDALAERHDVVVLDLPGFGSAPALPAGVLPTASALADAVEREMDVLGIATFHVAGYSLGGRIALELGTRGRTRSVLAIAPDGLGSPVERIYQAAALMTGHALAGAIAPSADRVGSSAVGRSMFFAMERSRPWQLTPSDAARLLVDFAAAPGYDATVWATLWDVPQRLHEISCPVLLLQGTADPLVSMQTPRYLPLVPGSRFRWLPGLSHVPISDDPELVASLMLEFTAATTTTASR
jgi:pimeloyl-ACP methyl ester carboxylesterase